MNHLECVTSKNNKWYWYLLVFFLSFVACNTIGAIPLLLVLLISIIKNGAGMSDMAAIAKMDFKTAGIDLNLAFACTLFTFAVMLIAAIVFIKLFHGRSWKEVINGTNRVRWSRFFFGFLVWGIISLLIFGINYLTEPEVFRLQFQPVQFFTLIVLAIIFIPLQATCEEFLCRGYLTQGIASWTHSRWWALIIPSVLFGLLHSTNPEIHEYGYFIMMAQYVFMGFMLGFMTIMDDGIELAMGVHTVHNLIGVTLVTYKGSALQTYALFENTEVNPAQELLPLVISGIALLVILAAKYRKQWSMVNGQWSMKNRN